LLHEQTPEITQLILEAATKARAETDGTPEPEYTHKRRIQWPVTCTVGPGLEGAIACESKVGYVNGSKGWLIYRGYNIFDLAAYSTYEEVCYLLLHGRLPTPSQLRRFKATIARYRQQPTTVRMLMNFPVEELHAMAALRLGSNLLRNQQAARAEDAAMPDVRTAIYSDEDSIPMEKPPTGEEHAIYEFKGRRGSTKAARALAMSFNRPLALDACHQLTAAVATLVGAIARVRSGHMPIEPDPDPEVSHAANLLYMITGRRPTPVEERILDVALILHADHGMNASTFACMVVASTLADIYFSVGAAIAALSGPLHGGANELVLHTLREIGSPGNVRAWFERAAAEKRRIPGFGHRVYKAYDPRARILGPLAKLLAEQNKNLWPLYRTAEVLERAVIAHLGAAKGVFPNVDFYSGLVYSGLGIQPDLFPPIFAVSRVAGWTARVLEYLQNNRIFRPRAMYIGSYDKPYVPLGQRGARPAPQPQA
jgi:citrate synthase